MSSVQSSADRASDDETGLDHSVAIVLTRQVPEGSIAAFETVLHQLLALAGTRPGHVHGDVLRGPVIAGQRAYHVIYRFENPESLIAWESSPERAALVQQAEALVARADRQELHGLEAWFDLPPGPGAPLPPPRRKMALLSWFGAWPLVSLALWLLAPHLSFLPLLGRTAIMVGLLIALMTWVVMPRLSKLAGPWLARG